MRIIATLAIVACMCLPAAAQDAFWTPMVPGGDGPMIQRLCGPMIPGCGPMNGTGGGGGGPATQAPTVTAVFPNSGPLAGGSLVTVTGTQFIGLAGAAAVTFGGTNATSYTVLSPTALQATSPAGSAGTVDVRVTNPIGTSAIVVADQFTYSAGCGPGSADFTVQCNNQYFIATQ